MFEQNVFKTQNILLKHSAINLVVQLNLIGRVTWESVREEGKSTEK